MSKSPEEIKQSVLKECVMQCVEVQWSDYPAFKPSTNTMIVDHGGYTTKERYVIESYSGGYRDWDFRFDETTEPESGRWEVLYSLLNLEARELEDRLKFTIGKLDEETWERQAAERKVMELEERAQGLVSALEEINEMTTNGPYTLLEAVTAIDMRSKQALNQWKGGGNG